MKIKGIFFNALGASKMGESVNGAIIAMPNKANHNINLLLAEEMKAIPGQLFKGYNVTFLTNKQVDLQAQGDRFFIENMQETTISLDDFSQMMQKKVWTLSNDHLKMSLLLTRLSDQKKSLLEAKQLDKPISLQKQIQRSIYRIYTEIIRRFSVAIAVFTFTLLGTSFGLSISRQHSNRGLFIVLGLASFYLIAFFVAKGISHLFAASTILYTAPHLLIVFLSLWTIRRTAKGIE
jgi:lipopolysaccharide export system permease protein